MIALWHRLPDHFEDQLQAVAGLCSAYHFDDGHDDVLRAADALEAHRLRGVFFVITARIGEPGYASQWQLRELVERGHEVGNHTRTHPMMPDLPAAAQCLEIAHAQADLSVMLGRRPKRFAWPHGRHDEIGDAVAAAFGFVEVRDISDVVRSIHTYTPRALRTHVSR